MLLFIDKSFFLSNGEFTKNDYPEGIYTNEKAIKIIEVVEIHLTYYFIDGGIVNGIRQHIL